MTRISGAVALAVLVVGNAACRDDSKPAPAASTDGSSAPRMRSLKIADSDGAPPAAEVEPAPAHSPTVNGSKAAISQSTTGSGNQQKLVTRSIAGTVNQRQEGEGNTQLLNVDAAGGHISQRQSGSGNVQSLNIGVTDNAPAQVAPGRARQ